MADMNRRGFVATVTAVVPAASQLAHKRRPAALIPSGPLNPETLLALGQTILPTDLGSDGVSRVVGAFQVWLSEYTAGAELLHGYGTGEIAYAPSDPTDRWNEQLDGLDAVARENTATSFHELTNPARTQIVVHVLGDVDGDRLPSPGRAHHVAVGLLAFFFATPEATDLCYGVNIAKNTCRPLADSPKRPEPVREP